VEALALLVVESVVLVVRDELQDRPVRQVRRFVDDDATVLDRGADGHGLET